MPLKKKQKNEEKMVKNHGIYGCVGLSSALHLGH